MDFAALNSLDLTPLATLLIAVGLAGMWFGRTPAQSSSVRGGASLQVPVGSIGGWRDAVAAIRHALLPGRHAIGSATRWSQVQPARQAAIPNTWSRAARAGRSGRRRVQRPVATRASAACIPVERQWSALETRVVAAIDGAGHAARLQVQALERLDAADYALGQLVRELDAVLNTRPAATVTPIRPKVVRPRQAMQVAA